MLYSRRLFPWTVRLIALWILFSAYAPPLVPGWGALDWSYQLGVDAVKDAMDIGAMILRGQWDALQAHWATTGYTGWLGLFAWLIAVAILKRITPLYSWPLHRFLSKKIVFDVMPAGIRIGRGGFEIGAIGPLAVTPHHAAMEHATRDQLLRDHGRMPTGRSFYYQNSFNVVLPYHGQPVVIMSIFGSKLVAEQIAARIMMVLKLVRQQGWAGPGRDEFGPAPSLPD